MKKFIKIVAPLSLLTGLAVLALSVVALQPATVSAASKSNGNDKSSKQQNDNKQNNKKPAKPAATYDYVAQPGDSYTLMARKAVQTYGIVNHITLSGAQIIFAETNLTQAADSPVLNVGQKVSLKVSDIEGWVTKAQKLTKAQQAAWDYYVQFVNFNTDNVGQPSK